MSKESEILFNADDVLKVNQTVVSETIDDALEIAFEEYAKAVETATIHTNSEAGRKGADATLRAIAADMRKMTADRWKRAKSRE